MPRKSIPEPLKPKASPTVFFIMNKKEVAIARFAYQAGVKDAARASSSHFSKEKFSAKIKAFGNRLVAEEKEQDGGDVFQAFFSAFNHKKPCPIDVEIREE